MGAVADPLRQTPNFLDDLTPDSGMAVRPVTPDEFRRVSSTVFEPGELLVNREEYYRLAKYGLLGPEERTELIYGRIITRMSPMSRPHSIAITKAAAALEVPFGGHSAIEQQMPLHLSNNLEVEPDVIVLRGSSQDYPEVPRPADVLLLVEVSHSTLQYDRNTKAKIYAENGIAEYWIVNLRSRALEVYRQPEDDEYISLRVYEESAAVAPLAAPDTLVRVADLLPIARG